MRPHHPLAAAVAIVAYGCATDRPAPPRAASSCSAPLASFCDRECPIYDKELARAQDELGARAPCERDSEDFPPEVIASACGALRAITILRGHDSTKEYFDRDGALVAAVRTADYPRFCDGTSEPMTFGAVPSCDERVTARFCVEGPGRRP